VKNPVAVAAQLVACGLGISSEVDENVDQFKQQW